jgi:CDP-glycerol glycerophosphotransferase (TagB/SpsB family)
MAFGEITHDNEELIDLLCDYMANGCQMKAEYRRRADDFFAFNDHNNCQRIYDVMIDYQHTVVEANR